MPGQISDIRYQISLDIKLWTNQRPWFRLKEFPSNMQQLSVCPSGSLRLNECGGALNLNECARALSWNSIPKDASLIIYLARALNVWAKPDWDNSQLYSSMPCSMRNPASLFLEIKVHYKDYIPEKRLSASFLQTTVVFIPGDNSHLHSWIRQSSSSLERTVLIPGYKSRLYFLR